VLAEWVRNNWRPISVEAEKKSSINVNVTDVLWNTNRAAVEAVMMEMLDVPVVDLADRRCFGARTVACKQVLNNMSVQDRALLDAELESRKTQGNPEDVQRE